MITDKVALPKMFALNVTLIFAFLVGAACSDHGFFETFFLLTAGQRMESLHVDLKPWLAAKFPVLWGSSDK